MLFYSIGLLLVHITCLHIFFVYIYLHLLAQDARLCHGRGKDHRILWTIVNASGRLRLHGFGVLRCACRREPSRSPPPPKYPSLRLCPATPGWGVRCGRVCLGSGSGCSLPLSAGLLRCACLCARSVCTPPLLAGVRGVGVCDWARVSASPRHSWLGCWGLCVFVCALRLYPATPGWGVRLGCLCLSSGFGCVWPPLPGVLGCVCAWCALRLCPATPGWGVRCGRVCLGSGCGCSLPLSAGLLRCACLCARSVCTPPLLAGVRGVGVCDWARVSAAPRHSWLGCLGGCVLVCTLRLYPATPGWAVRRGCVCLGSGFGCAPRVLAGVFGWVCACVRAPLVPCHSWLGCAVLVCVLRFGFRLRLATPGWGVGVCVCVCVLAPLVPRHSWHGCALSVGVSRLWFLLRPATPGWGVEVFVCVCVLALLVPRHSWLRCAVWVCVLALGFRLRPATPGWGVGVCVFVCALRLYPATPGWAVWCGFVCLGSGFGCAPPLLPGVRGVWVWCCVAPVPVPRLIACCARRPGLRHPVAVVAWHLSGCLGCGRRRASLACLVALLWCATPRPVRSLSVVWSAFPTRWCRSPPRGLAPPALLGGCAGHAEAGLEPGSLCLPLAPAVAGALGSLRVVPVRGPTMGLSLAGPSGVGLGLRALR